MCPYCPKTEVTYEHIRRHVVYYACTDCPLTRTTSEARRRHEQRTGHAMELKNCAPRLAMSHAALETTVRLPEVRLQRIDAATNSPLSSIVEEATRQAGINLRPYHQTESQPIRESVPDDTIMVHPDWVDPLPLPTHYELPATTWADLADLNMFAEVASQQPYLVDRASSPVSACWLAGLHTDTTTIAPTAPPSPTLSEILADL